MNTELIYNYTVCNDVTHISYDCDTLSEAYAAAKRYAQYGFGAIVTVKTTRLTWEGNKIAYSIFNDKSIFVFPKRVTLHSALTIFRHNGKPTNDYFKW